MACSLSLHDLVTLELLFRLIWLCSALNLKSINSSSNTCYKTENEEEWAVMQIHKCLSFYACVDSRYVWFVFFIDVCDWWLLLFHFLEKRNNTANGCILSEISSKRAGIFCFFFIIPFSCFPDRFLCICNQLFPEIF